MSIQNNRDWLALLSLLLSSDHRPQSPDMTANLTDPLSPCYSDCDSVSGLLEKDNNIKNNNNNNSKIKRDILSQVVQTFRFSRSRQYTTLGSCPNLPHISSETSVLKDNEKYDKFKDKMLNVNTPYGTVQIFKTGNPLGPSLVTLHDLGLNGFSNFSGFFSQPACAGRMRLNIP